MWPLWVHKLVCYNAVPCACHRRLDWDYIVQTETALWHSLSRFMNSNTADTANPDLVVRAYGIDWACVRPATPDITWLEITSFWIQLYDGPTSMNNTSRYFKIVFKFYSEKKSDYFFTRLYLQPMAWKWHTHWRKLCIWVTPCYQLC